MKSLLFLASFWFGHVLSLRSRLPHYAQLIQSSVQANAELLRIYICACCCLAPRMLAPPYTAGARNTSWLCKPSIRSLTPSPHSQEGFLPV